MLAGASLGAEVGRLRWDPAGVVAAASPTEQAALATVVVGARWSRWGQAAVVVPTRWSHRVATGLVDGGGGVGDVRLSATIDPFEEQLGPKQGGLPIPVWSVGARLPTGRDWTESQTPLLADVTGAPGLGLTSALSLERTLGRFPYWVVADLGLDPEVPARLGVSGGFGQYLGASWTWLASARHEQQLSAGGTSRTTVGARVVYGRPLAWRGWVGLSSDVPASGLGSDQVVLSSVDLGVALIR